MSNERGFIPPREAGRSIPQTYAIRSIRGGETPANVKKEVDSIWGVHGRYSINLVDSVQNLLQKDPLLNHPDENDTKAVVMNKRSRRNIRIGEALASIPLGIEVVASAVTDVLQNFGDKVPTLPHALASGITLAVLLSSLVGSGLWIGGLATNGRANRLLKMSLPDYVSPEI